MNFLKNFLKLIFLFFITYNCLNNFSVNSSFAQSRSNNMLNSKQQNLVPIAAFTAIGDIGKLQSALKDGLDSGLTINEIKEAMIHSYAYAGFPRALNGLNTLMNVLKERKAVGISDPIGRDASPISTNQSMLEMGKEIQTKLAGHPVTGAVFDFAPVINQFLQSHLFGDLFTRDVLDYSTREVITISILATLPGLNDQLQAHYNLGINSGLTVDQLKNIIVVLQNKVGKDIGANAQLILEKTLNQRK